MFLSKEKRKEDDIEVVQCSDCKALVAITSAQKIINNFGFGVIVTSYYCKTHSKPYSRISFGQCFKEVEVDKEGTPIGYIKKPEETSQTAKTKNGPK